VKPQWEKRLLRLWNRPISKLRKARSPFDSAHTLPPPSKACLCEGLLDKLVFTRVNYCLGSGSLVPIILLAGSPRTRTSQADAGNGREEGAKKEHRGVADSVPPQSGDDTCR